MPPVVLHGDCLEHLRTLPDASVHAICTDPPYGLADHKPAMLEATLLAWLTGDRERVPDGRGFMGKNWDAFVPPPAVWDECLRVLKPGGHMVVFAGSRTVDLMGLSIRLAGFEIRDEITTWLYGSGFPKSLDVSKAIDKAAGAEREVVGTKLGIPGYSLAPGASSRQDYRMSGNPAGECAVTAPATDAAKQWQGWGTALKPSHEPVIVARKPLQGTVAQTVLEHGTGGLNIDACRVAHSDDLSRYDRSATSGFKNGGVYGDGKAVLAPASPAGRWPTNVVLVHSPDCDGQCAPGCPVAELDQQSGIGASSKPSTNGRYGAHKQNGANKVYGSGLHSSTPNTPPYGDSGGASRFFPTFRYQAKAPARERPKVNGIAHPTCKPLALMRWLVRLCVPPGGTVLDPFAGSGTTIEAAILEGFDVIGIEREADYLPLIQQRIDRATQQQPEPQPPSLFDLESA